MPRAVEAITKSALLTLKISDLKTRAVPGQANAPIASEMLQTLRYWDSTDMMTTAARMYGIEKKMSPTRESTESIQPP